MTETDQEPEAAPDAASPAYEHADHGIQLRDIFVEWLTANGIDPLRTPMWAELTIDTGSGTIHIEQMITYAGNVWPVISGGTITRMRQFPLVEPMGEDLAAAWEMHAERQRNLMRLQYALRESGSTVVSIGEGQKLLFVLQGRPKDAEKLGEEQLTQTLRQILPPGVEVGIVYGVQAVVVQAV